MSTKDVEEISKDKEDTIVSDVLEELLQEPPPPLPAKDRPVGSPPKPTVHDDDDDLYLWMTEESRWRLLLRYVWIIYVGGCFVVRV